jgi:hypothetical protein
VARDGLRALGQHAREEYLGHRLARHVLALRQVEQCEQGREHVEHRTHDAELVPAADETLGAKPGPAAMKTPGGASRWFPEIIAAPRASAGKPAPVWKASIPWSEITIARTPSPACSRIDPIQWST